MELIVFISLFVLSAFFSGSESAYTAITPAHIEGLRKRSTPTNRLAYKLAIHTQQALSTSLIGNNITNVALAVYTTNIVLRYFSSLSLGLMTALLTMLLVVLGEFHPKQFAIRHPVRWIQVTLYPFACFVVLFYPVSLLVKWATTGFRRSVNPKKSMTKEHVVHSISLAYGQSAVPNQFGTFLINTVRFEQSTVQQAMVHRTDMTMISCEQSIDSALAVMASTGFSRLPVYQHNEDHIIGIVFMKELLRATITDSTPNERTSAAVSSVMMQPHFISQSMKLGAVFIDLKKRHIQMAIVQDEYGGVAGLITIEDLLEEIFGELYDENEREDTTEIVKTDDGYQIKADVTVQTLNDTLGLSLPSSKDRRTLSGYIIKLCGAVPQVRQQINTPVGTFVIVRATKQRVKMVHFVPNAAPADSTNELD